MIRKAFFIREDQQESLNSIPGNDSEHIRQALDEYIAKLAPKASISPSQKGGKDVSAEYIPSISQE